MFHGMGPAEMLVVAAIALVMFGLPAALITFLIWIRNSNKTAEERGTVPDGFVRASKYPKEVTQSRSIAQRFARRCFNRS
jgi:Sec-independent protein translocase protein TatA